MSDETLSTDAVLGAAKAWLRARENDPQRVGVAVNKSGAGVISTMADEITRLRAENEELRDVIKEYESDPDYARSRFREIDLLKDQRAHDRLKIQGIRARVEELEKALDEIVGSRWDGGYKATAKRMRAIARRARGETER